MRVEIKDGTGYIRFSDGKAVESLSIPDTGLVLDFNGNGELIGIETVSASEDLPEQFLEDAEGVSE